MKVCIDKNAAFGIFARALPETAEFAQLHRKAEGIELADSIAADGHKLLNVVSPSRSAITGTRLTPSALRLRYLLHPPQTSPRINIRQRKRRIPLHPRRSHYSQSFEYWNRKLSSFQGSASLRSFVQRRSRGYRKDAGSHGPADPKGRRVNPRLGRL